MGKENEILMSSNRQTRVVETYKGYKLKYERTKCYTDEYYVLTPDKRRTAGLSFKSEIDACSIFKEYVDLGKVFDLPLEY